MEKPNEIKIWLYESCPIHTIKVSHQMTGCDTSETYFIIGGSKGERKFLSSVVQPLIRLEWGYSSIADLNYGVRDQVAKWKEFEKQNATDLAELERLKKKLGL